MDFTNALIILKLDGISINEIDEVTLKKTYRNLMKENHPDLSGGSTEIAQSINEAYEVVKKQLESIKKIKEYYRSLQKNRIVCYIPFDKLPGLYSGGTIKVRGTTSGLNEELIIDKKTIRVYDVILSIHVEVEINGITRQYDFLTLWEYSDNYEVTIKFEDSNILEETEAVVSVYNKKNKIKLSKFGAIQLVFDNNVRLKVSIERCEKKDD